MKSLPKGRHVRPPAHARHAKRNDTGFAQNGSRHNNAALEGFFMRKGIAILLSVVMIAALLPQTVFAEEGGSDDVSSTPSLLASGDATFDKILNPGTPDGFSEDIANPYGYGQGESFMLSQQDELFLYYSFDTKNNTNSNKYAGWFNHYNRKTSMSLRPASNSGFAENGEYGTDAYSYVTAVGFDPNSTGRNDHVALVGYENLTDRDPGQGYVLWVTNAVSGEKYGPIRLSGASCSWLKDKKPDLYAGGNFFNIVAGDFDGDGKESLVVGVVDNGNDYGMCEVVFENGSLSVRTQGSRSMLHPVYDRLKDKINSNNTADKLSMDFAAGDFNGDGVDDLAVVSCPNKGNKLNKTSNMDSAEFGMPYLAISYGEKCGGNILASADAHAYIDAGKSGDDSITSIGTSLSAGDINNDGKDEIIAAGYKAQTHGTAQSNKGEFKLSSGDMWLYASYFASGSSLTNIEYQELNMNAWSSYASTRNDPASAKVAVEVVPIYGKGSQEHIFISGNMYQCQPDSNKLLIADNVSPTTLDYFKNADKSVEGKLVGKSYIASTAVGNFEESIDGYEQIAYVVGLQSSDSSHKYSFSVHMGGASFDDEGTFEEYYQISGSYIFYNQSFDLEARPNCIVAAIDRDNDGIVAKYRNASYAWSDPQVQAILQASPYFGELNDGTYGYEYLEDNPSTTYSTTVSYSFERGTSNAVSFGAGFAGEISGSVGPQIELQTGYALDWCESFTKTFEESITTTYSAGMYDTVVMYRTPVIVYSYDVTYFNQDGDAFTDVLQIAIPKAPHYDQLSIGGYNDFVTYYNNTLKEAGEKKGMKPAEYEASYLQQIADGLFLEAEGNPYGYYQDDRSGGLNPVPDQYGNLLPLSKNAGGNSSEYSYTESDSKSKEMAHGFTFDFTITFGFDVGGTSARAGGYVSLQYMKGSSTTTTNGAGTSFEATVMGLDGKTMKEDGLDPDAWGFNWRLGKWNSNLTDGSENSTGYVPIIGYVLSSVTSPSMPVKNESVQFARGEDGSDAQFKLAWECGDEEESGYPETAGYRIYLYDPADDAYRLVETINGKNTTTFDYETYLDGRESYRFQIRSFAAATPTAPSVESVPRSATYYLSTATSPILKIEKTGTSGLNDTYTIFFRDGSTQDFTVTNGNGIASIELVESNADTRVDTYQILFTDGSTATFTVTNGAKGETGEAGTDGKDGVGVARIEKVESNGLIDTYAVYLTDDTFYVFTVTNGRDGANGHDGIDGKDGAAGIAGAAGANGRDGTNGTNGRDGADGKDGVSVAAVRTDDNGNLIFTLSDGTTLNAGGNTQIADHTNQLVSLQSQVDGLQQQVHDLQALRTIAYLGLILALISLAWHVVTLVREIRKNVGRAASA